MGRTHDGLDKLSGGGMQPLNIGGAWAFAGTMIPLYALYENVAAGTTTITEFAEWFPGVSE